MNHLTLVKTSSRKRQTNIDLHDKAVVRAVATAIARTRVPKIESHACASDARTVISSWVLGQPVEIAAQRLLSWWCIDTGMTPLTIEKGFHNTASDDSIERVMSIAKTGYAALEAIEKYGKSWIEKAPFPREA